MEKKLLPMSGIISTFITPFTENNQIDIDALHKEIELGIQEGVSGFLIPCDASESPCLTEEEMVLLVREARQAAQDRCMLISNVKATDRETRIKQCENYLAAGADALNLFLQPDPCRTEEEYLSAVRDIDEIHPRFMLLQDADMVGSGLPIETIVHAFEQFDSVRGVKIEVKDSGNKYTELKRLTNDTLNISCAKGRDQLIEAYDRGIHCFMPSGLFKIYVNSFKLYHEKSRDAARKLFYDMAPLMLFTCQKDRINEYFHKSYFMRRGIFKNNYLRVPLELDSYREKICQEMVDLALQIDDHMAEYWA